MHPHASYTRYSVLSQGGSSWECALRKIPSSSYWITRICLALLDGLVLLSGKGLLNALESFKELTNTLWYCMLGEVILGLPSTWAHTKDVTCKVLVIKGPWFLHELGHLRAV